MPVVDVVRTDSHLEFYEDPKNLARMSDILAVYAWVDPETGYCQGMGFPLLILLRILISLASVENMEKVFVVCIFSRHKVVCLSMLQE